MGPVGTTPTHEQALRYAPIEHSSVAYGGMVPPVVTRIGPTVAVVAVLEAGSSVELGAGIEVPGVSHPTTGTTSVRVAVATMLSNY